jgi:chromosome segregation ATPase
MINKKWAQENQLLARRNLGTVDETLDPLSAELTEAQESYSGANKRIVELLDEKIALKRERDELAAALERARQLIGDLAEVVLTGFYRKHCLEVLGELADPAAILAAREKPLREALKAANEVIEAWEMFSNGQSNIVRPQRITREYKQALAAAPEAKP